MIDMLDSRHGCAMCRAITFEFVGHQPPRLTTLAFDQATKEAFGRLLVASSLYENIYRIAVLIDRAPEIVLFPLES